MSDTKKLLQQHFDSLRAKRDAIRAEVAPLYAARDALHAQIAPLQAQIEEISAKINAKVNCPEFIALKQEIADVANALGARKLSEGK